MEIHLKRIQKLIFWIFTAPYCRCLLRFWRDGRYQEGSKRVSGGSDGSENLKSLLGYDPKDLLKGQESLIRSISFQGLIFFNNSKSKFDLKISPVLLLC